MNIHRAPSLRHQPRTTLFDPDRRLPHRSFQLSRQHGRHPGCYVSPRSNSPRPTDRMADLETVPSGGSSSLVRFIPTVLLEELRRLPRLESRRNRLWSILDGVSVQIEGRGSSLGAQQRTHTRRRETTKCKAEANPFPQTESSTPS